MRSYYLGGALMPGTKGKSGGQRPGAGRPAAFKSRRGEYLILERETIGGEIRKPELVRLLSISAGEIELQTGNDIIVLRAPDEDEITLASPPS